MNWWFFMNDAYMECQDVVQFTIQSDFGGVNETIMLPLTLVEDLQEHINSFDGAVVYPINSVVFYALCVYLDYINVELVRFDMVKADVERCMELDIQEMMVESNE